MKFSFEACHGSDMVALVRCTCRKPNLQNTNEDPVSVLGWVPGLITMVLAGILFWITSITMHKFIMKNLKIKDICKL